MVVGFGERAIKLAKALESSREYGVRLMGFLADREDAPPDIQLERAYRVYALSRLQEVLRSQVIDEIIFAVDSRLLADLEEVFLFCDEEGVRTRVAVDFFPHVNSEVYLDRFAGAPLLTFAAAPHDEMRLVFKRMIDVSCWPAPRSFCLRR
jgi:FlaA1/EpsC-like NDP-sugar epimerase